jgi:hypothetical protein
MLLSPRGTTRERRPAIWWVSKRFQRAAGRSHFRSSTS